MKTFFKVDREFDRLEDMLNALAGYTREYAEYTMTHVGTYHKHESYGTEVRNGKKTYYIRIEAEQE